MLFRSLKLRTFIKVLDLIKLDSPLGVVFVVAVKAMIRKDRLDVLGDNNPSLCLGIWGSIIDRKEGRCIARRRHDHCENQSIEHASAFVRVVHDLEWSLLLRLRRKFQFSVATLVFNADGVSVSDFGDASGNTACPRDCFPTTSSILPAESCD